ncbi:6-O-methylguanine DNA methyltransferase [Thioclava sp. SK-1]|uniref:bifunctional transcriptional activator/DNA repair enzyme AdaA n=1 Tax=Thioclava sp. SK-1 TaxID=1889770 RepID=UPI0008253ECE|nr:trifunctional transcriptional activator/DNA repair protein Ada/methylated-DNA--[protein]-cysteine S-methyltransferase [Thioclava sp. SK-1]OCX67071.1 6-O-methylguanine DNA methyltransferase [Thioclava sp. SK-1]
MLFALPDDDTLYAALVARDARYDGQAFVGVTSTGILCRLTCPARKPKRENCKFFDTIGTALAEGFRPCKRCHPLARVSEADPVIATLLGALDADPTRRWYEGDIAALGVDPSTARRAFKRAFGMTFLELARQRRLGAGLGTLAMGARVIDAQMTSGFDSASAFRAAVTRILGQPPGAFSDMPLLFIDWIDTPLGPMLAICDHMTLHLLEFMDRKGLPAELQKLHRFTHGRIGFGKTPATAQIRAELAAYFRGECAEFTIPLALHGTEFSKTVWDALRQIPVAQTRSYADLARAIDRPSAMRAVARANGANQIAIVIPCHRVIGSDGSLTGYAGGLWRKQKLLEVEQAFQK